MTRPRTTRFGPGSPWAARARSAGFTLTEALIASAILAFVVAALTQAITAGQMQTYDAVHQGRAIALAEALVEEMLRLPYHDPTGQIAPGPDAGESDRDTFDNIDDYHGHTEPVGAVTDAAGNPYPDAYARFGRSVTARYETMTVSPLGDVPGLRVTVTVVDDRGRSWTITRFVPEPAS